MATTENNSLPKMGGSESEKTLKNILDTNVEGFSEYVYEPLLNIDSSINIQLHELVYEPLFEIYECLVKGFQGISENNFKSRIEEEIRLREKKSEEEKVKKAEESAKKEKDPKKTDRSDISKFLKTGNIFKDTLTGITRSIKDDIMDFTDKEVVSGIKLNQIITPLEKLKDSLDARSEDQILNDKIVDKLDEIKGFQEALDPDKGKSFTDEERKIAESNLEVAKKQLELLEGQKKSQTQLQEESLFKTDSQKVKDAVVSEDGKKVGSELKDDKESFKLPTLQGIKDKFKSIKSGIASIGTFFTSLSSGFMSLSASLLPIIATVAAVALIGYSLYQSVTSMFDVFVETGSVMEALKVGISTFFGTLIGLPFDLIKGALSYIVDWLGFQDFSNFLDSFSFVEILTNAYKNLLDWIEFALIQINNFVRDIFGIDVGAMLIGILGGIWYTIQYPFVWLNSLIDNLFGINIGELVTKAVGGIWDIVMIPFTGLAGVVKQIFDFDWMSMLKNIPGMSFLLDKMGVGGKEEGGPKLDPKKSEDLVSKAEKSGLFIDDWGKNSVDASKLKGASTQTLQALLQTGNLDSKNTKLVEAELTKKLSLMNSQNPKKNLGINLNEKESALRESNMEMNSPKQSKGDVSVISDSSTRTNSQINITKEVKAPSLGRGRFARGVY